MAADSAAAAVDNSGSSPSGSSRSHRDQMQEAAFDILTAVLDVAGESDEVGQTGQGREVPLMAAAGVSRAQFIKG